MTPVRSPMHGGSHRRTIIALLIAAVLAVTIVAVMALPMRVEVAKVTRGPILAAFGADGYVESESVDIAPMVMGPVESIPVHEGERVAAGTSLARLTSHDAEATAAA